MEIIIQKALEFGKEFARKRMPKYDSEVLTIAFRPTPDIDDEISKLLVGEGLFKKISTIHFCRQYLFEKGEYRERSLDEIKQEPYPKTEGIKYIFFHPISKDYYRITYDGGEGYEGELVGQSREIDAEWNGTQFVLIERTDHLKVIT